MAKKALRAESLEMINLLPVVSQGRELNKEQILMLRKNVFRFGNQELKDKFVNLYGDDEDEMAYTSGANTSNKKADLKHNEATNGESTRNKTFDHDFKKSALFEIIKAVIKIAGDLLVDWFCSDD